MTEITAEELARVNSFPRLVGLLRDKLEWPINEEYEFEDVIFEYEPHELGLKSEETAKLREIHQLRPLVTGQPWGIFFLSFDDKTMSVTVLRRILRALVVKQRASGQSADRAAWEKEDLIFAANFGKSGERELAFVHFSDAASTGDLPVMKVLGWNAQDTTLHNRHAAELLASRLTWPDDQADQKGWRGKWASAFEVGHREVITTSKDLAVRLAALAGDIRARANQLLAVETETGPMRSMLDAFRKNLIHDLDDDGFADMFAQTICYGMLAARISRPVGIIADNLADMVPKTNPFLKELFANFLHIGGRDKRQGMDFDELGVRDVVDMLNRANMEAVLRDFGDKNPKEDPVIHFYELFLKEYDPQKRMQRGVFYTPRPVVNFIVRGVDEILRTEFDLPMGLADTSTWAQLAAQNNSITIPDHIDPNAPFVQILDPATGTGTFLVEVIDLIHKRMVETWQADSKSAAEIKVEWNAYVAQHLLPRLTAFELMMAPYAIAHMKVGLKLVETGYTFVSDERARIFLTNALEPARDLDMEFLFMSEALAREAQAANDAKSRTLFTAIIGNPPYSKISANLQDHAVALVNPFRYLNGVKIKERGALAFEMAIQDDYVKFFGLAQSYFMKNKHIVAGMITNSRYTNGIYLRGFRRARLNFTGQVTTIDLGGQISERANESGTDENVFDIEQGVAISFHVGLVGSQPPITRYRRLLGTREQKYQNLISEGYQSDCVEVSPQPDLYLFVPTSQDDIGNGYGKWLTLDNIFKANSGSVITSRDNLLIDFEEPSLAKKISQFADLTKPLSKVMDDIGFSAKSSWNVNKARNSAKLDIEQKKYSGLVKNIYYRPFDVRKIYYNTDIIDTASRPICVDLFDLENLAIHTPKIKNTLDFNHVMASPFPSEKKAASHDRATQMFPLFVRLPEVSTKLMRQPNIDRVWAEGVGHTLSLAYQDGIPRGQQGSLGQDFIKPKAEQIDLLDTPWNGRGDLAKTFGPRDLFDYIYAVLHAPTYRSRYAEFLRSDFPRIPTPGSRALFADLVLLGRELVALHLLKPNEAAALKTPEIRFAGSGEARVGKGYPEYTNGKVMINDTRWFEDVPKATWEFHVGGYQPCEKWLKDRAAKGGKKPSDGRVLTDEDVLHYRRMVIALTETRRIMAEIDTKIAAHGGWPAAFMIASSEASTPLRAPASLPDGKWAWPATIQPGDRLPYAAQYALWKIDPAAGASRIRFVIASLAEPRLLTPLLSDDDRATWIRLVGPEALLQTGVARLRPEVNAAWRAMFEALITSGQLTEQSDGSWSRGPHFSDAGLDPVSVDAQRAAFVLHTVHELEVSDLQAAIAWEDNVVWANIGHG